MKIMKIILFFFLFFSFQNIDTFDLEDLKYNYVNLTAFRLFNRRDSRVQMAMESFFAFKTMSNNENNRRLFTVSYSRKKKFL